MLRIASGLFYLHGKIICLYSLKLFNTTLGLYIMQFVRAIVLNILLMHTYTQTHQQMLCLSQYFGLSSIGMKWERKILMFDVMPYHNLLISSPIVYMSCYNFQNKLWAETANNLYYAERSKQNRQQTKHNIMYLQNNHTPHNVHIVKCPQL